MKFAKMNNIIIIITLDLYYISGCFLSKIVHGNREGGPESIHWRRSQSVISDQITQLDQQEDSVS